MTAQEYVLQSRTDDDFALEGSITVGRHLDNDMIVAGEDVKDFHLRIRVDARGPKLHVLRGAVVRLNDETIDRDAGLLPNDTIAIGQQELRLKYNVLEGDRMESWALVGFGPAPTVLIDGQMMVGRTDDVDLTLKDGHVSRRHARVSEHDGTLWVEDLGSANGTFVNGKRIERAARLLHGDEVAFDIVAFQVTAAGGDLTPTRPSGMPMFGGHQIDAPTLTDFEREVPLETTEMSAVNLDEVGSAELPDEAGCYLCGVSENVAGRIELLELGRYGVGRHRDSAIQVDHPSVSNRHAEVNIRSEGCYVSDLMSTNGVFVNGERIQAVALEDGDKVAFGSVVWLFRRRAALSPRPNRILWLSALGIVLLAVLAALFLI